MADKPIIRRRAGSYRDIRQDAFAETLIGMPMGGQGRAFIGGANPVSGLQDPSRDRTVFNKSDSFIGGLWTDTQNIDLYMSSGIAARIVDLVAEDCTSNGITIEGDDSQGIMSELSRLRWVERFTDCIRWARLHGGAAIILLTDDAPDLSVPLNINNIGQISDLRVVDVTFLSINSWYLDDPRADNYGTPQSYMVQTRGMAQPYTVHESRLIPFGGAPVPGYVARSMNVPWRGRSVYQGCRKSLLRYASGMAWSERMMERKQQLVWRMHGMADLLLESFDVASGVSMGKAVIQDRVQSFDMVRGIMNTAVTDGEDAIEVKDLSLSGVYEMFSSYQMDISADTGIPVTTLFGRSPAGHNATGQSDQENYHNLVDNVQHSSLEPALQRIIPLILLQKEYKYEQPKKWTLSFNPLWSPTDEEQAKAKMQDAQAELFLSQAAVAYVTAGILAPDEVAQDLAEKHKYGLSPDMMMNRDPVPVLAANAQAQQETQDA